VLKNVDEIEFVYFDQKDVVRHELVQRIIRAYEAAEGKTPEADQEELPLCVMPAPVVPAGPAVIELASRTEDVPVEDLPHEIPSADEGEVLGK
jgi:hypothetical protein